MDANPFIQDLAVMLALAGLVGWVFQRLGLSTVVGYLLAGVLVGPHTPPFALVTDVPRVETLAQLGLVILMFSIGMRLHLRKLRRLGLGLLLAVAAAAGVILFITRLAGACLGLGAAESLFLAGMIMVSSSAIISRILTECGVTHEKSGQLALTVTVLEDVVAVVMLTLLGSLAALGGGGSGLGVGGTLATMSAFVVMACVCGLLLVPWLLRRLSISADEELQTLGIAGLLFGLALLAQKAGYSTALGAFLLGSIVAETPNRTQIDRLFEGMRSIFSAVFFIAIGMQIDPVVLPGLALPILGLTVFTVLVRLLGCSVGLSLIGIAPRDAMRTGLLVLPIGEFSFIIAQLGASAGVVPQSFYPLAVGLSLTTALLAPIATRRSEGLVGFMLRHHPRWLDDILRSYHDWLERLDSQQKRNQLWQLSRKRIVQVGVGMLFVTGILVFSERLLQVVVAALGRDWLFPHGPELLFWSLLTLVVLIPLLAIWRNLSAMAMLFAQLSSKGYREADKVRVVVEHGLRIIAASGLFLWLASVLPMEGGAKWLLLVTGLTACVALLFLRRKLVYWHSEVEVELQSILSPRHPVSAATSVPWLQSREEWNMAVIDCIIPDLADVRGKSLGTFDLRARTGASVVGIERQGYMIQLPGPEVVLYPRDKVLLLGGADQVREAARELTRVTGAALEEAHFEEIHMEKLIVDTGSKAAGMVLGDLHTLRPGPVLVAGLIRDGQPMASPAAGDRMQAGDELLVLGTRDRIRALKQWVRSASEP